MAGVGICISRRTSQGRQLTQAARVTTSLGSNGAAVKGTASLSGFY